MDMQKYESQLAQIDFQLSPTNDLVVVHFIPSSFRLIGLGTDAVVVQHADLPAFVFKVYHPAKAYKVEHEFSAYQQLGDHPSFCQCVGRGERWLLLSYEEGPTLLDCLEQGIVIPKQVIQDVESARIYVRSVGLNPRDLHLKNVILQEGHIKILDVSEYVHAGDDRRWDHLVQGYYQFYGLIRGRKIPYWVIEWVKKSYYLQMGETFTVHEFGRHFAQMLSWKENDEDERSR